MRVKNSPENLRPNRKKYQLNDVVTIISMNDVLNVVI